MAAPNLTPLNDVVPEPPKKSEAIDRSYLSALYPEGQRDMLYARKEHELPDVKVHVPKRTPKLRGGKVAWYGAVLLLPPIVLDAVFGLVVGPNFWGMTIVYLPFVATLLLSGLMVWWLAARKIIQHLNHYDVNARAYTALYICAMAPLAYMLRGAVTSWLEGGVLWAATYTGSAMAAGVACLLVIWRIDRTLAHHRQ